MPKGQRLALDLGAQQHASQPGPKAQSSVLGLAERDQQRALATEGDLDQAIRDVNHEIAQMDNNMTPINLTSPQETSVQNAGKADEGTGKSMGMVVPSVQVSIPVKQQQSKPTGPSKRKLTSKLAASTGKSASKADKVAGAFPSAVPVTSSFVSELQIVHNRASPFVAGGAHPTGPVAKKSKQKGTARKAGRAPAA